MPDAPLRNLSLEEAVKAAEAEHTRLNPKSGERFADACASMPGGNTRTVLHYSPFPLTIARAEGSRLEDVDGHAYTDFLGEYTAGLYGHSHPVILGAIREAIDAGVVLGGPNRWEAELARLMCQRFPSVELVRFTNSGTESNMMAVVTARAATGRDKVLVFNGGYHGGVLSFAGGGSPINAPFQFVLATYNDIAGTEALIDKHASELAAVLVEPMMGGGGGIAGTPAFLQMLRDATKRHGIVLIFDEVMTSRLSAGGLQAKLGINPDLTSFGKYLGGGMSFGAFGGRADLLRRYDPRAADAWSHAGTFNNNVLTMSAGVAGLTKLFTPEAAERLNASGDRLRERLNAAGRRAGVPLQCRGVGSIMAIHWQSKPIERPADTAETPMAARTLFHLQMLNRGFYIARRGFMSLSLVLTEQDHDRLVAAVEDYLETHKPVLGESLS
jgi:glutamate-1-semialdehyde 2,1-aminomutase